MSFKLGEEVIDLTEHLVVDDFDLVMRAIDGVVDDSAGLLLNYHNDRSVLKNRLKKALGAVVSPEKMDL